MTTDRSHRQSDESDPYSLASILNTPTPWLLRVPMPLWWLLAAATLAALIIF